MDTRHWEHTDTDRTAPRSHPQTLTWDRENTHIYDSPPHLILHYTLLHTPEWELFSGFVIRTCEEWRTWRENYLCDWETHLLRTMRRRPLHSESETKQRINIWVHYYSHPSLILSRKRENRENTLPHPHTYNYYLHTQSTFLLSFHFSKSFSCIERTCLLVFLSLSLFRQPS